MKNAFHNSAFSIAETCWSGISLFLLFRYVAASLGVAAIGAWSLLIATMSISSIADIGFGRALLHFVPTAIVRENRADAAAFIETSVVAVGVLFLVVLLSAVPVFSWAIREFVAPAEQQMVMRILPYALLSFWLSNVSLVFLSGLGGMQRYDIRSVVSMVGSATQLLVAIITIRFAGLLGLIWAQMAQNVVMLLGGALTLRYILPEIHRIPVHLSFSHFKAMRRYGTSLQLYTFASFVFEPATKVMLSHFGGLSMVGFYEMGSRVATQVRTLIVNAIQVLVPALAELYDRDRPRAFQAYLRVSEVIWILACPIMATVLICLPAISSVWLGRQSREFITFSLIVATGWTVNLICAPAYLMGLASGVLKWNLMGAVVITVSNLILGPLFGLAWGAVGVVLAFSVSLSAGSLLIFFFNHMKFGGTVEQICKVPNFVMVALLVGAVAIANMLSNIVLVRSGLGAFLGLCAMLIGVAVWISLAFNPATGMLFSMVRARLAGTDSIR